MLEKVLGPNYTGIFPAALFQTPDGHLLYRHSASAVNRSATESINPYCDTSPFSLRIFLSVFLRLYENKYDSIYSNINGATTEVTSAKLIYGADVTVSVHQSMPPIRVLTYTALADGAYLYCVHKKTKPENFQHNFI